MQKGEREIQTILWGTQPCLIFGGFEDLPKNPMPAAGVQKLRNQARQNASLPLILANFSAATKATLTSVERRL